MSVEMIARMWLANLMANVSLSISYQMHDGLQAGQSPGADQSHFGLVRAVAHPAGSDDSRYWQPKRGYFAAVAFTSILHGRELSPPAKRPVVVATPASAKTHNTTFAMSFRVPSSARDSTGRATVSSTGSSRRADTVMSVLNLDAVEVLVVWSV